jgi:hypothetical protein
VVCLVKDTKSTTTTKLLQGLEQGEEYTMEVAALCEAGEGPRSQPSNEVDIPKAAPKPRQRPGANSGGAGPVRLCGKLSTAMRQGISAGVKVKGEILLGERSWCRDLLRCWRDSATGQVSILPRGAALLVGEEMAHGQLSKAPKVELMPMLAKKSMKQP